jgi:dTDP-4-dehydrorhamnose reductase
MLGSQVLLGAPDGLEAVGTDLREAPGVEIVDLDLTEEAGVSRAIHDHGPFTGVIHTAAYTAVDRAEKEPDLAMHVNGTACGVLARICAREDVPLVVVGTDFVFDGKSRVPYSEDVEPNPLSVYGRTKLAGERLARQAHPEGTRIVRTQWLYGPRGKHFPGTMQQLARERSKLRVVNDQFGCPTSTLELAPALWDVLLSGSAGIYHAACEGACSWYELAVATVEYSGIEGVTVEACSSAEYPRAATLPAYSVLDCSKLTALRSHSLASWQDALKTLLGKEADE